MIFKNTEKSVTVAAVMSFLISFLLVRFGGFSVSVVVNLQNHIVKSMIIDTAGMGTIGSISAVSGHFIPLFVSMIFFTLSISILAYYGYNNSNKTVGRSVGVISAIFAIVLFPSVSGVFFALAVMVCSVYSQQFANTYGKELKRWVFFRTGSNTAGKMMLLANIIVSLGVFFAVLYQQPVYETSFRQELTDSMMSIALYMPGASSIPLDTLNQRIESVIASSPLFTGYIRWLPVTTAFSVFVLLELLRNIILANLSGLFTYVMLRTSNKSKG